MLNFSKITQTMDTVVKWACYGYAFILFVFGCQHFIYADFCANQLMPPWIPWHLFFVYFTGIALIAAGISIVINRMRSLATVLLGVMILLFLPLMHLPILVNSHWQGGNITNACKDLGLACGAFLISGIRQRREEEMVERGRVVEVGRPVAGEGVVVD